MDNSDVFNIVMLMLTFCGAVFAYFEVRYRRVKYRVKELESSHFALESEKKRIEMVLLSMESVAKASSIVSGTLDSTIERLYLESDIDQQLVNRTLDVIYSARADHEISLTELMLWSKDPNIAEAAFRQIAEISNSPSHLSKMHIALELIPIDKREHFNEHLKNFEKRLTSVIDS